MNLIYARTLLLICGFASLGLTQTTSTKRSLLLVAAEASCQNIEIRDARNNKIHLPQDIEQHLKCGWASLSPNSDILAFMAADKLTLYQFSSRKKTILYSVNGLLVRSNDTKFIEGLEFTWSPDNSRLGLLLISQNGLFPTATQLRVFDLQGIKALIRHDYNLDVAFTCGSTCTSLETRFLSRNQWRYQTQFTLTLQDNKKRFAVLTLKP